MRVEALAPVLRRMRRRVPDRVRLAFAASVERLAGGPLGPPDRPVTWRKVWRSQISNHRHLDLPDGWRLCYAVEAKTGAEPVVVIVFVGTHKEYDQVYGYQTS